jgi:hypothetical protein
MHGRKKICEIMKCKEYKNKDKNTITKEITTCPKIKKNSSSNLTQTSIIITNF